MTRAALLLAAVLGLAGCSSEPPGPSAATLTLALESPVQDDGAVLITITGGPVDSIEAPGYRLYSKVVDPTSYRIIVAGSMTSGPIAQIHIPDQKRAADYSAVLEQVAARASYSQGDPAGYGLRLEP